MLSPVKQNYENTKINILEDTDQLKVILDLLGPQSEDSLAFITSSKSQAYHDVIQNNIPKTSSVNLKEVFPWCSNKLVDILTSMLEYNPAFRPSTKELL